MLVESICIALIISVALFGFMRTHRKEYTIAASPLLILPLGHALTFFLDDVTSLVLSVNVKVGIDVFWLALSVAIIGILSNGLKTKKSRVGYMIICGGFETILALIFITNYYSAG